jgi:outer membrane protein assembly factor BamE (lipoprotein component of BamABCDE complex)
MEGKPRTQFTLRALLAVVVAVAIVAGLVRAWPYVPIDRINSLSDGMSEAQVLKVMGDPSSAGPADII